MHKAQKMVQAYYDYESRERLLEEKLIRVERKIEAIRKDIKTCNVDLDTGVSSIDYSKPYIQGSNSSSSLIEKQLIREMDKLIRRLESAIREKYKIKAKIINNKEKRDNIEIILNTLSEDERELLKRRYGGFRGEIRPYEHIAADMFCSTATVFNKHRRIMQYLENYCK